MAAGLDEDTVRTLQSGRASLGSMLREAQRNLQVVFIVWVAALLVTIYALQEFIWTEVKSDILAQAPNARIIVVSPFDVILLQVKIGVIVGVIAIIPLLIYYSRDALRARGLWPGQKVPARYLLSIIAISILLFVAGIVYSYEIFFPVMFDFLADNAASADFKPHYSIVKWVNFVALLGLSFGLAAQLPLVMTGLSYTGIVPYETFRDRWRWAVVIIFTFGAMFSPPDPFTQVMWATPLVGLYGISLGISKVVVQAKRAGEAVGVKRVARQHWNALAGVWLLFAAGSYYVVMNPQTWGYIKAFVGWASSRYRPQDVLRPRLFGIPAYQTAAVIGALIGVVVVVAVLYYFLVQALDEADTGRGTYGDPSAIDVGSLSASGVRAAPPEAFAEMDEPEALELAQGAMDADQPEKAEAILERFDETEDIREAEGEGGDAEGGAAAEGEDGGGGILTGTTAGVMDAFTEDETTEDDIGGYYYDIAFIFKSLTSKAIWFAGTFAIVAGVTFVFLYTGIPGQSNALAESGELTAANGTVVDDDVLVVADNVTAIDQNRDIVRENVLLVARDAPNSSVQARPATSVVTNKSKFMEGATVVGNGTEYNASNTTVLVQPETTTVTTSGIGIVKNIFVSNLPPRMQNQVNFVTLHPVEHLIFIVKFSSILGILAMLPPFLFFAWKPLQERDIVSGDRNILTVWGGTLFVTLVAGSLFGFLFVAPTVVSWLVRDQLQAGMIISYRVAKFGWIIIALTVGIGTLTEVPITMLLFHRGGIVTFQQLQDHWRPVTLGVFLAAALFSPKGIWTMFLIAIPITVAFMAGLALLWAVTLGGRRTSKSKRRTAD